MQYSWYKTAIPIAAIFAFRMLGLFMLIPVFTIYAPMLNGSTPFLIGIALGAYGLTQGLLQIPFGIWSDSIGRKPILFLGLCLFGIGSLIGIFSESIYSMILARTLQGMGAIGSVLIALLTDITPEEYRARSMAIVGITIAISFSIAMLASPLITAHYGLSGIFHVTVFLALCGIFLLYKVIPNPPVTPFRNDAITWKKRLSEAVLNRHLQRLDISIFCQHFILTATFYMVPILLQKQHIPGNVSEAWHFYMGILVASFLCMLPFIRFAEKKQWMKRLFTGAVLVILASQILLSFLAGSWIWFCGLMLSYFVAFNILEASLPALLSRQTIPISKGAAMGIYSSCQFLGIFVGGICAGFLYQWAEGYGIFLGNAMVGLFWMKVMFSMQPDAVFSVLTLSCDHLEMQEDTLVTQLKTMTGIHDVAIMKPDGLVYLLINKASYQTGSAEKVLNISHGIQN